jgi:hypothetical protein
MKKSKSGHNGQSKQTDNGKNTGPGVTPRTTVKAKEYNASIPSPALSTTTSQSHKRGKI